MNDQIKFNITELEQLMWNAVLETFQQAMVEILSTLDMYLMAKRDKNRYKYKEIKERTYVTMLGSIDQELGLDARVQVSTCLKGLVVLWATKGPSYRDVSRVCRHPATAD